MLTSEFIDKPDIYDVDIYKKIKEIGKKGSKYAEHERLKSLLTNIDEKKKDFYIRSLESSNQLKFMNLHLMAEVIAFMDSINDNVNKKTVKKETIAPYINSILPRKTEYVEKYGLDDYNNMVEEMYASFLRYVFHLKIVLPKK